MDKMKMHSTDTVSENIKKLAELFPQCVMECKDNDSKLTHKIDWEMLQQELSSAVVDGTQERYTLNWPGKREAILLANSPVVKTLRPCRGESVDFDNTKNLYIEGDNLDVLKLLRDTYLGKVKMIYIDPPYNTGNDFVYRDKFSASKAEFSEKNESVFRTGNYEGIFGDGKLEANPETKGRYHSDWLTMIYPRLRLAHQLLCNDGAIFISCDDNEVTNLHKVCEEIFGEENFIGQIAVVNNLKGRNDKKDIATCHEYLIIYGKKDFLAKGLPLTEEQKAKFNKIDKRGNRYQLRDLRKRGRPDRREDRPNMYFPIFYDQETKQCDIVKHDGWVEIFPLRGDGSDGRWRWGKDRVSSNLAILEPSFSKIANRWGVEHRVYLNPSLNPVLSSDDSDDDDDEERSAKSKSVWLGGELSSDVARRQFKELMNNNAFDYPKSIYFLKQVIYMGSSPGDIILDFFSGSATTAHAVMQLNTEDGGDRQFLMVQLPEVCAADSEATKAGYKNICEIGKERIRRAGTKIKAEWKAKQADAESDLFTKNCDTPKLDVGFRVLKLDSSNMENAYYTPDSTTQDTLTGIIDNVKPDRASEDLLFQVMLDWGVELSSPITVEKLNEKTVYFVDTDAIAACFDIGIDNNLVRVIADRHVLRAVFRDNGFASDAAKINVVEIFKQLSPETEVKVI